MRTKQFLILLLFLSYSFVSNAQWTTTGNNIYYNKGKVGIGTTGPTESLTINGDASVGIHTRVWNGYGTKLYLRGVGNADDEIYLVKYSNYTTRDETELRVNLGDDRNGEDRFVIGNYLYNTTTWHPFFVVQNDGKVGINGVTNPKAELDVKGKIRAKEVEVTVNAGADFVFEDNYELMSLSEVEAFIRDNKHLPEVPSEKEMQENGLNMNEFQIKLLQKIEELTLYTIKQQGEIEELKTLNQNLMNRVNVLIME